MTKDNVVDLSKRRAAKKLNEEGGIEFLTEQEIEALILAVVKGQGGINEAGGLRIIHWAEEVRLGNILIDMVVDGHLVIRIDEDGEPLFFAPEKDSSEEDPDSSTS